MSNDTIRMEYQGTHTQPIRHVIGARNYRAQKGAVIDAEPGDVAELERRNWKRVRAAVKPAAPKTAPIHEPAAESKPDAAPKAEAPKAAR